MRSEDVEEEENCGCGTDHCYKPRIPNLTYDEPYFQREEFKSREADLNFGDDIEKEESDILYNDCNLGYNVGNDTDREEFNKDCNLGYNVGNDREEEIKYRKIPDYDGVFWKQDKVKQKRSSYSSTVMAYYILHIINIPVLFVIRKIIVILIALTIVLIVKDCLKEYEEEKIKQSNGIETRVVINEIV